MVAIDSTAAEAILHDSPPAIYTWVCEYVQRVARDQKQEQAGPLLACLPLAPPTLLSAITERRRRRLGPVWSR